MLNRVASYIAVLLGLFVVSTTSAITIEELKRLIDQLKLECLTSYPSIVTDSKLICPGDFDLYWGCWPPTAANTVASIECKSIFFKKGQISRKCSVNGTWEKMTVRGYKDKCDRLPFKEFLKRREEFLLARKLATQEELDREAHEIYMRQVERDILYYLRIIDSIVCGLSLMLIAWLIPMKNKRFILHWFLVLAAFSNDVLHLSIANKKKFLNNYQCSMVSFGIDYSFLVLICMTFSEGFYQFRQFYFVFVTNQRVWAYVAFSYILPAVLTFGVYMPLMFWDPPVNDFQICWRYVERHKYNYIVFAPVLLLLTLNIFITIYLMRLIVSKLRSEKTSELSKLRKTVRGFLVLLFLLGGGFAVTTYGPDEHWYRIIRALVHPSQGMIICFIQVLLSHHIIDALKRKLRRAKAKTQFSSEYGSRDIRKYGPGQNAQKRGSTTSTISLLKIFRKLRIAKTSSESEETDPKEDNTSTDGQTDVSMAKDIHFHTSSTTIHVHTDLDSSSHTNNAYVDDLDGNSVSEDKKDIGQSSDTGNTKE